MWLVVFQNLDEYIKDFLIIFILIGFNVCDRNSICSIHLKHRNQTDVMGYNENHNEQRKIYSNEIIYNNIYL
jgi:hypothetical protein